MSAPPQIFTWNGEAMVPLRPKMADEHYTVGERYLLVEQHERSQATHNHFFAAVAEAWQNLPDHLAERFPTDTHLRKHALVKAGYFDVRSIVCSTKAEAVRIAAFLQPMDSYAVVTVSDYVVSVFTARSQSTKAMGAKDFQASKSAVLEIIADMIGVTREEAERAAS